MLGKSVLIYGSETWTLTKSLEKIIDGTYTRLLRTVFNLSWSDLLTNRESSIGYWENNGKKTKVSRTLCEIFRRGGI